MHAITRAYHCALPYLYQQLSCLQLQKKKLLSLHPHSSTGKSFFPHTIRAQKCLFSRTVTRAQRALQLPLHFCDKLQTLKEQMKSSYKVVQTFGMITCIDFNWFKPTLHANYEHYWAINVKISCKHSHVQTLSLSLSHTHKVRAYHREVQAGWAHFSLMGGQGCPTSVHTQGKKDTQKNPSTITQDDDSNRNVSSDLKPLALHQKDFMNVINWQEKHRNHSWWG